MGATYNLARTAQLADAGRRRAGGRAATASAGGLAVPCVLALATATWVWVLPETRGIAAAQPELHPRRTPTLTAVQ